MGKKKYTKRPNPVEAQAARQMPLTFRERHLADDPGALRAVVPVVVQHVEESAAVVHDGRRRGKGGLRVYRTVVRGVLSHITTDAIIDR